MNKKRVKSIRNLTESVFVLAFERADEKFLPGQHVNVGIPGDEDRPYSLYNGINDENFEILVKEVPNGNISRKLKNLQPGDFISVAEPRGYFTIHEEFYQENDIWLICTGTGISPYHSFVKSYPGLKYMIIHGIGTSKEFYDKDTYVNGKYVSCTSRDTSGDYIGRVTSYLDKAILDTESFYFVCGSYEMIDEVYDVLISKGVKSELIKSEGYF